MSIVAATSAISILCDCPYTGKTREIKTSPEKDLQRKNEILQSLKETKEELVIARHVLVDTRHRLALLQRILSLELGYVVSPHVITEPTWKNRVREESYLKSEQLKLVDYLRKCDPRYRSDLDANPTRLSASTEDLLSAVQEKTLRQLYLGYTVYHSGIEKQLGSSLWEFFQLKERYENKLYQNRVMGREMDATKRKISDFQRQFLENKCLIDYITDHHFTMVGCFSHVFPEKSSHKKENERKSIVDSEAMKFKELWENSKLQKRALLDSAQALKKELENVNERIILAEYVCSKNVIAFTSLAEKLKEGVVLTKLLPMRKEIFGEFSTIHYRSQKRQLEAAIDENKYLKKFLRKTILSKTEDLNQYRQSLQSTTERYRCVLENIRNELIEKEFKEKEVTVKKTEKKKKK